MTAKTIIPVLHYTLVRPYVTPGADLVLSMLREYLLEVLESLLHIESLLSVQ